MNQKIKIGLTGNMGCGKSMIRKLFANYPGVTVIDTDSLAKEIAGRPEHAEQVKEIVGFAMDFSNARHREKLATKFSFDKELRKTYEAFIHPLVWKSVDETYASMERGLCIVESAILFEVANEHHYEKIIVVTCDEPVQFARLRDGDRAMPEAAIRARMRMQVPQHEKVAHADYVIDNSGSLDLLKEKVFELYQELNLLIMKPEKVTALFVGSFDPPTLGHQWLVQESLNRYDHVVVGVTVNALKSSLFSVEERLAMLREMLPVRVKIVSFDGMYSVDYAESIGAIVLVRGVRNETDREYEKLIENVNQRINPSITTECIRTPDELAHISSSVVKQLIGPKGWESVVKEYVPKPVLIRLIAKYHGLFADLQAMGAQGNAIDFWKKVLAPYLESDRYYHGIKHITDMIAEFKTVRHLCEDPVAVEYAIWLHDYFNDTMVRRCENEERSGKFACEFAAELGLPDQFGQKVNQLILATKHNRPITDHDAQILVDLDFAILGALPRVFNLYEENIRKEYAWMDDEVFNRRRLELLKRFCLRDMLYYTEIFQQKYEAQARQNLQGSIIKLS